MQGQASKMPAPAPTPKKLAAPAITEEEKKRKTMKPEAMQQTILGGAQTLG